MSEYKKPKDRLFVAKLEARIKELEAIAEIKDPEQHFEQIMSALKESKAENTKLKEALENVKIWTETGYKTIPNVMVTIIDSAYGIAKQALESEDKT